MGAKPADAILVDAGTGNLHSVDHALRHLGYTIHITSQPDDLRHGGRVILPGVGAFAAFLNGLRQRGLVEALADIVQRGDLLLGICVGMQALFTLGEEIGQHAGLDLLPGNVVRFPDFSDRKVPHTGWNQLWFEQGSPLLEGVSPGAHVYFNHSFYCKPANPADILARTDYGIDFASMVCRQNLFGVQFHPEKSQRTGQRILSNFIRAK
ncbi:MAG TPA: imidazole glycerol phosphate synthase subunit HisH [Levilinea sp.]|nr:imidazole glycerol phosphate synthase subunit HisH [Levilinea sp.]